MSNINNVLADIALVVILQISGITLDVNLKLQLAGLAGSMLAVRTIDNKIGSFDWLKVAFSGMIMANYAGGYFCEIYEIQLYTFKALFWYFSFGFGSDIILRCVKVAGKTAINEVPTIIKSLADKIKAFFIK